MCRSWFEDREEEEEPRSRELVFQEVDALRGRQGSQGLMRKGNDKEAPKGMELFPFRISGPTENRINVAFFGDGCESPTLPSVHSFPPQAQVMMLIPLPVFYKT